MMTLLQWYFVNKIISVYLGGNRPLAGFEAINFSPTLAAFSLVLWVSSEFILNAQ